MRIAYIAAGAGGMYCGSCIHDNALAAALMGAGHDVVLMPVYTPLRTDEPNVSGPRVFYGALNVYLQQKAKLFRRTPWGLDRLLDRPALLRWISRLGASTDARQLGELTVAVLDGESGPQRKELEKLVAWLRDDFRPEVVQITNSLLLGLARRIRAETGAAVVTAVQGEDLFLEQLPKPYRERVLGEMRRRAADVDLFVAPSRWYGDRMAALLALPEERMRVVPLGIRIHPAGDRASGEPGLAIGYLARICPEKGLHLLVEAFRELASEPGAEGLSLRVAGYIGPRDRDYLQKVIRDVDRWGLTGRFELWGEVDREEKSQFLQSIDLLAVPTVYREPKGLFALEAMAAGVPVVLPRHGSFPEIIEATGGGLLVEPGSPADLAAGLRRLIADPELRRQHGERGRDAVRERFNERVMAEATLEVYREAVGARRDERPG